MIVLRIFLWILLSILLLLFLLLSLKISIDIRYNKTVSLRVRVLFFRYQLVPKKKKKVNHRQFTYKKHEKRLAKKRAKEEAALAKKEALAREKAALPKEEKPKKHYSIRALIRAGIYLIKTVPPRLFRCFHFDFSRLVIVVGTDDAAKTAIRYGWISQSVAYLLALISKGAHLSRRSFKRTRVEADFLSTDISADIDMTISIRPIRLIPFGIGALFRLIKAKGILDQAAMEADKKAEEKGANAASPSAPVTKKAQ